MENLFTMLDTLLLNSVAFALQDFETMLEIDTSLEVSANEVPIVHVKNEFNMQYIQTEKDTSIVIFQNDALANLVSRKANRDNDCCILDQAIVSLVRFHDDQNIKLVVEANSGCDDIATIEELATLDIDAKKVFERIEYLISSEKRNF